MNTFDISNKILNFGRDRRLKTWKIKTKLWNFFFNTRRVGRSRARKVRYSWDNNLLGCQPFLNIFRSSFLPKLFQKMCQNNNFPRNSFKKTKKCLEFDTYSAFLPKSRHGQQHPNRDCLGSSQISQRPVEYLKASDWTSTPGSVLGCTSVCVCVPACLSSCAICTKSFCSRSQCVSLRIFCNLICFKRFVMW